MAGKLTGFITRWLTRRAGQGAEHPGHVQQPADPSLPAEASADDPSLPAEAPADDPSRAAAPVRDSEPGAEHAAASDPGAGAAPVASALLPGQHPGEDTVPATAADSAQTGAPVDVAAATGTATRAASIPAKVQDAVDVSAAVASAATNDEDHAAIDAQETPSPTDPAPGTPAARKPVLEPAIRERKVITIVSLAPHSGAKTLCAALEARVGERDWQIRATGPGLTRAAFSGMLTDTDALLLLAPAEPEATKGLGQRLQWLEANNRQALVGRTIFVLNRGTTDGGTVQLPADLSRPVVLLPFDPALSLPQTRERAPRRAARHALGHLIDELTTIIQEN